MKHIYPFNATPRWRWLIAILAIIGCTATAHAQVKGLVFRDFDSNGIRSDTLPIETSVAGVIVRAFVGFSPTPLSTITTDDGSYSFNSIDVPAGQPVRIEFDNFQSGYYNSSNGTNNGTSVQFVRAPADHVNLGINVPTDYCQPTGKLLITSCFVNGDSQTILDKDGKPVPPEKQTALTDAILTFPYEASGIAGPDNFPPAHLATAGQVGTVWGMAYQRRAKKIFSTSFVKRHTSFGPAGPGGIYLTDLASGATRTFMSVSDVGIDVGEDPHKDPLANLFGDRTAASADPSAFTAVGRMSFGGTDMSEDDKTLYFINLKDRKLYGLLVDLPAVVPTSPTAVKSWDIPNPGCSNGDFRPWALKVYRGKIYVGVVCSAETSQLQSDLKATIYRIDPNAANAVFEEVLSFPLDFHRGPLDITGTCITKDHWIPWSDTWPAPCGEGPTPRFMMSPQPMITDIEFDVDGSMFIGMLSRFAHMGGVANHDIYGKADYDFFGFGDLLRAYNNKGTFELEKNGKAGPLTGNGVGNGDGPVDENGVGGEFYGDDYWIFFGNVANREVTSGSLSFLPGYNAIITSSTDVLAERYLAGGFKVFNASNGTTTRNFELYRLVDGLFGKAGGLGDNKLICDPAPIEIGNRFWFDDNRNGIQDAYETGVDGVALTLHDLENGGIQIATQTTHDGGQFYFNNSTVAAGLQYNHRYEIRMDTAQLTGLDIALEGVQPVAGGTQRQYKLSPANSSNFTNPDLRDSDAQLVGSTAIIAFTTQDVGQNDFTNDLGIYTCPELRNAKRILSLCAGTALDSIVSTGTHLSRVDSVRFVVFSSPQSGTAMYGSGGTVLGTVQPNLATGQAVLYTPTLNLTNTTAGVINQYVYALVWPMPADPSCRRSSQTVLIISPEVSASATGGALTCSIRQVSLSGQAHYSDGSPTPDATYSWVGPDGFSSNQQNPSVSEAGVYTLTVGNPACPSLLVTAAATVTSSTVVPAVSVNNLTLTCANPSGILTADVTAGISPYTYLWNTGTTTASITARTAGPYSVTITGDNGCVATGSTTVISDVAPPDLVVNSLILTCTNPSGILTANATGGTAPYTYLWSTGATTASITASTDGPYSVTVTADNGCRTTNSTTVASDTAIPSASINNLTLTCTNQSGMLSASVTAGTGPYTYLWSTGATTASITTSTADLYSVTVTGANGCITTATTPVISDTVLPAASVNSLDLTCTNPSGTLSASVTGGTGSYLYQWNTGQTTASITTSVAGPYSVIVTGENGCSSTTLTTTVTANTVSPVMTTTVVAKSCVDCAATIAATSPGSILSWTGPNNFVAIGPGAQVTADGTYTVTATASNGCFVSATLAVTPFLCPELRTSQASLSLCSGMSLDSLTTATLRLGSGDQVRFVVFSSPQSGTAMYENRGIVIGTVRPDQPNGRAVLYNPSLNTVNPTGTYRPLYIYATVYPIPADPICRQSSQTVLHIAPVISASASGGELTCKITQVILLGQAYYGDGSAAPNVVYSWSGPNGFSSSQPNPGVSAAGNYTLTVSSLDCPSSGSRAIAIVTSNKAIPVMTTTLTPKICPPCPATVAAVSPGSVLSWEGPNNFAAIGPGAQVTADGTYTVTATAGNGCSVSARLAVVPFICTDTCVPIIVRRNSK